MFKLLLVGFLSFVSGQDSISCGTGFVYNMAVSSCLPTSPGSNCCDASLASCQDAIKLCMASGTATTNCQALACSTRMPSPTCCDPTLISCQTAIRTCLTNTLNPQICQALACPTPSVSPIRTQPQYSTTATVKASPNAMSTFTRPIESSTATPKQTLASNTPKQADASATTSETATTSRTETSTATSTATSSASNTPKRTEPSASNTPKQTEPSASNTPKQTEPSASNTPRQVDRTATATTTYKQTDSSMSMKPADPAASASASVSMKPTRSVYPSRFVKYSFSIRPRPSQYVFPGNFTTFISSSIIFPKANHTLLREPAKLQELQIILACILRMPLEGIEITNIATSSIDLPFDTSIARLNSNGQIVCINLPSVSTTQGPALRRLQVADTTVSYNILNPNNVFMTDKDSFATSITTDSNILSYANSVGSTNPTVIPPIVLFTLISPEPSTVPAQPPSAGAIVGGIIGGILVIGLIGVAVVTMVHLRNRVPPITSVKKPSIAVSNPLNYTNSSHVVFNPVPTRRST